MYSVSQGRRVHLFGLTGGIASGKSTVAARLRERGVPVIDADEVAREVVAPGSDGLSALVQTFGPSILGVDGALDRKGLAALVFGDAERRAKLNAIVHPLISRRTMERSAELAARGEPLTCYEAALLIENGVADAFRPLVVVACSEEEQIARVVARDGSEQKDAIARIRAQKPLNEKVAVADFVIDTTGTGLDDTRRRADDVLLDVCERLGIDVRRYPLQRPSTSA
jgi:dephospho-CoA kinase